ncbi:MAG: hypothetical protein R2769_09620 [Saprospiraceae bacterium]
MKGFFENQRALKHLEIRQASQKQTIPLKLQAYERLALFCERIAIPNLLLRMREEGMTAKDLRISMLLAIQQEFEYNLTQQVYVSEQLWEIIKLARDETVNIVNEVCNELPKEADGRQLAGTLLNLWMVNQPDWIRLKWPLKKKPVLCCKLEFFRIHSS